MKTLGAQEVEAPSSAPSSPLTASPTSGGSGRWTISSDKRDKKPKTTKLTEDELEGDHYEALGLGKLALVASEEQIKAAYKRLVVETHPDKTKDGDDRRFKAVQKAYEVLSDPLKKVAYDSSRPFDDEIPQSKVPESDFYEEFGDCFALNARWSIHQPVPELGGPKTPIEQVNKFYDFWTAFRSWRDFSHVDEHNLEEAESREEKRWMERENDRERAKLAKLEVKRIATLVERAKNNDPRLRAHREMLKQKAEEEKAAAMLKKQQQQEEKERRAREVEEAERRLQEAAAAEKKQLQQIKREMHQRTRALVEAAVQPFVSSQVTTVLLEASICRVDAEWVFGKLGVEKTQTMRWRLEAIAARHGTSLPSLSEPCRADVVAELNAAILAAEEATGRDRFGNLCHRKSLEASAQESAALPGAEWDPEELQRLREALRTIEAGTTHRWQEIAAHVGGRPVEEVLARAEEMARDVAEAALELETAKAAEPPPATAKKGGTPKPKAKKPAARRR